MKKIFFVIPIILVGLFAANAQQWTSYTNFNHVSQLAFQPGENIIWGATPGGIFSFSADDTVLIKHYTNVDGLPYIEASSIIIDRNQNKWIGALGGGQTKLDSSGVDWQIYTSDDGLASDTVVSLASNDRYVFCGGYSCLSVYNRTTGTFDIQLYGIQGYPLGNGIQAVSTRNDSLWLATDQGLRIVTRTYPLALIRDTINWTTFANYDGLSTDIRCILLADTLSMIGTINGAARLVGGVWQKIPGLGDQIRAMAQVGDSIFFATNNGVKLWHQGLLSDISSGLNSLNALSLTIDDNYRLWVGTDEGLCVFENAGWKCFSFNCQRDNNINDLAVSDNGTIWLAHPESGISFLENGIWNHYDQSSVGLPINNPSYIGIAAENSLWVGTWGSGLFIRKPDSIWLSLSSPSPLPTPFVGQILPVVGGVYLINYDIPEGIDAVSYFNNADSSWHYFYAQTNKFYPTCIAVDRSNNLWIGSYYNGLYRVTPSGIWNRWSTTSGLSTNHVYSLCPVSNGNLWIGSENGLFLFDGTRFTGYNTSNSPISSNTVYSIDNDRADNLWIGTSNGLNRLSWDGRWTAYSSEFSSPFFSGLINNTVIKVLAVPDVALKENIFIATSRGLSILSYNDVLQRTEDLTYIAPNPLDLSKNDHIYFSNLPSEARIDIYTLDGRLCGTFHGPPSPAHTLTVRPQTDFNKPPASGIYICRISSAERKTHICKLVIVR